MKIIKTENKSKSLELFKSGLSKIGTSFKGNIKRNLVIFGALVLICGAVALNIKLFAKQPEEDYDPSFYNSGDKQTSADTSADKKNDSYFAMAVIDRSQSRDEALEVLYSIAQNENATEEAKSEAFDKIEKMAKVIEQESNIQTLVKSKGFEECIAVIDNDNASIIVSSQGLLPSEIAQITEIVYEQAGIIPSNIKIIEKN